MFVRKGQIINKDQFKDALKEDVPGEIWEESMKLAKNKEQQAKGLTKRRAPRNSVSDFGR